MSLVCPSCGASYRAGFSTCSACGGVALVDPDTARAMKAALDSPKKALDGKKTVALVQAALPACRELERALLDAGVPCFIAAESEEGEGLLPGALKVSLMIGEDDLAHAADVLRGRFEHTQLKDGVRVAAAAVDLSAPVVTCPACGHEGELKDGACADCGLFLGAG